MYNPSRGGVRGGADQFTWESVKTDKHRENYLGHSLKAPVGRWQKGKDLSWYAKERKDDEDNLKAERSELAEIKRAEEEAMLIALGQKVVRKESQSLTKEEIKEVLKRNIGDRDELNIERIDGVGSTNRRTALLTGTSKDPRSKNEGVLFETHREKNSTVEKARESSPSQKRTKSKKKSKKHKREKKSKRSQSNSDSEDSESETTTRKKHKKHKREYDSSQNLLKAKHKKSKHGHKSSSSSENECHKRVKNKARVKHRTQELNDLPPKRRRHDTSESD